MIVITFIENGQHRLFLAVILSVKDFSGFSCCKCDLQCSPLCGERKKDRCEEHLGTFHTRKQENYLHLKIKSDLKKNKYIKIYVAWSQVGTFAS